MRAALPLVVTLLVSCAGEVSDQLPPGVECIPGGCNDDDACTDDLCIDGQCEHLPRDVASACRTDLHCDDHDPCTRDSCGVDTCGLQRCEHPRIGDCQNCEDSTQCFDAAQCRFDGTCVAGRCEYRASALCDERFDPEGAHASALVVGHLELMHACACPCESTTLGLGGRPLLAEPPIRCDVSCDGPETTLDCAPIAADLRWIVRGAWVADAWRADAWRVSPEMLDPWHRSDVRFDWDVTIAWSKPVVGVSRFRIRAASLALTDLTCEGDCPIIETTSRGGGPFVGQVIVGLLDANGDRPLLMAQVYPQSDNLSGPIVDLPAPGDGPASDYEGVITLVPHAE